MKANDVTGVILSGGFSKRMDSNKALLEIDGVKMIERVYDIMKSVFKNVIISTNEPELYGFIDTVKVKDIYLHLGPLSGIHAALSSTTSQKIFLLSCDMLFIQPSIIKHLLKIETEEMIVVPKAGNRVQYLCGIYDKKILPVVENILTAASEAKNKNEEVRSSALSLWNFAERIGAEIADVEYERFYFNDLFFNINTPDDFEYAKSKLFF